MSLKEDNQKRISREITSRARFVRTPPDKIRYLVKMIKGKEANRAISLLEFSRKEARKPLILVLKNALSVAKDLPSRQAGKNIDEPIYIKTIIVDEGPKLKRRRIIHRGRATSILKRQSHITVVLSEQPKSKIKSQKSKSMLTKSQKLIQKYEK